MINSIPLACFLSMIRPPGVQFDNALLQIAPVDKTKCPLVRDSSDVTFQLYTRYNPTQLQELVIGDDDKLLASHMNFHDKTVIFFHAFMEMPQDGSGVLVREAYMLRGDVNMIMVDASQLEAGPWYFTAADNTWYIGRFAAKFIDFLVSRGLDLSKTHLVGHSLGAQAAGVAGAFITSGRVSRITGLDPALPLFAKLPLEQRLDPSDADFVDVIHTDAGIFGVNFPSGHADFYPNGGISPQPGCELEVVLHQQQFFNKFFCSHWRSYMFYAESVLRPEAFVASPCGSWRGYKVGACASKGRAHMGFAAEPTSMQPQGYYTFDLQPNTREPTGTHKHKKHTGTQESDSIQNRKHLIYQKTKRLHEVKDKYSTVSTESSNIESKYDVVKESMVVKDLDLKHSIQNMKKHLIYLDKKEDKYGVTSRYNIKAKYTIPTEKIDTMYDVKDLGSTYEELDSDLDLTAAEADLETTLTRMKLRNTDNKDIEEVNTKLKTANFAKPKNPDNKNIEETAKLKTVDIAQTTTLLVSLHSPGKKTESNLKESRSYSDIKAEPDSTTMKTLLDSTDKKTESNLKESQSYSDRKAPETDSTTIKKTESNPKEPHSISDITDESDSKTDTHIKKRQKRFLSFFQRSEAVESENFLFRILEFLNKNRRHVIPVFTVMREINTLVKSANGELNHSTKERNNYIGHNPPVLPLANYNLELGSDSKARAFVKRLLGLKVEGDRLSITGK